MKELYISPEATLVGFVATQNMADIDVDNQALFGESGENGAVPGISGSDVEVPV